MKLRNLLMWWARWGINLAEISAVICTVYVLQHMWKEALYCLVPSVLWSLVGVGIAVVMRICGQSIRSVQHVIGPDFDLGDMIQNSAPGVVHVARDPLKQTTIRWEIVRKDTRAP